MGSVAIPHIIDRVRGAVHSKQKTALSSGPFFCAVADPRSLENRRRCHGATLTTITHGHHLLLSLGWLEDERPACVPAMNVIIIAHCKVSVKLDLCQGLVERYG